MRLADADWSAPRTPAVHLTDRALHFIKPPSLDALCKQVVVGITHRNDPGRLQAALRSVMAQDMADELAILVLDDSSADSWMCHLDDVLLQDPRLVVAAGRFGSAAHARNALLDLVDDHLPAAQWTARLDADDLLAEAGSLRALVEAGRRADSDYVLGSNMLRENDQLLTTINWAVGTTLLDRASLNRFIQAFCRQQTPHELPSCNLLIRTRTGIRYPLPASAEDHWLVASLLMRIPERGCVVTTPPYAIYSLGGTATGSNKRTKDWLRARLALAQAADTWFKLFQEGSTVLGWGQEGVVWRANDGLYKRLYPGAISADELQATRALSRLTDSAVIAFEVVEQSEPGALIKLLDLPLVPVNCQLSLAQMQTFLSKLYRARVVTSNIKRDNLRLTEAGELQYIDIGRDIVALNASRFLDCAARLYAIGWMGWSDNELSRRKTSQSQVEALDPLTGFAEFYGQLVMHIHHGQASAASDLCAVTPSHHDDVTLLIKACPQDVDSLRSQVAHIVGELRHVCTFEHVILLIDPYEGPYLRQYARGNMALLVAEAARLREEGWLDEVWVAPTEEEVIQATYARWFGRSDVAQTHTGLLAPLFSQLWAFNKVETTYVLQVDVDVLVSLSDASHDVIADMKEAMRDASIWCVGFNIPKANSGFEVYSGEPHEFAAEVRFGLLNLPSIMAHAPFENPVSQGHFDWMWHRVLKEVQPTLGMRNVRGGDSRSAYVHPRNADKSSPKLATARDLMSQGMIPSEQTECWDLITQAAWQHPRRNEDIVFLLFGRDTPTAKLERCFKSLRSQSDQRFGVIFIEDGGECHLTTGFQHRLAWLRGRLTLIRRPTRVRHLRNFRDAIEEICVRPETLLVVLDQDDLLMGDDVVERISKEWRKGADLINGPMFRPDKPLQLYPVSYDEPRSKGGGNVWAHLRAFRKSLFNQVPTTAWDDAPAMDCLSDFLTMVPMAELAQQPCYLDGPYVYLHDRGAYDPERKRREATAKTWLFSQAPLVSKKNEQTLLSAHASIPEPIVR